MRNVWNMFYHTIHDLYIQKYIFYYEYEDELSVNLSCVKEL